MVQPLEEKKEPDIFADKWGDINILGLLLREIIKRAMKSIRRPERLLKARSKIGIKAGKMSSTLEIEKGLIKITNGIKEDVDVIVKGSLPSFLKMNSDGVSLLPLLKGKIRISGNPIRLLPLIILLKNAISGR